MLKRGLDIAFKTLIQHDATSNDAERHTHKATTPALKELWSKVANETLQRPGDEGGAIREANADVRVPIGVPIVRFCFGGNDVK